MKIINYKSKYKDDIKRLESQQWGEGSDSDEILNDLDKYKIKLAKDNNSIIGVMVWHITETNSCFLDFIIIDPEYQRKGLGTALMNILIDYAKNNNCIKIECEAIDVKGHINAKKLLKNSGFVELYEIKNYWGEKCPDFDCKECGCKPCICSMHKYEKELKQMYLKYKQIATANGGALKFVKSDKLMGYDEAVIINNTEIRAEFYKFILHLYQYDQLPKLVSSTRFKLLNKPELLHGFVKYSYGRDYLTKPEVFDSGYIPSGFYVTGHSHMPFAKGYTSKKENDYNDSAKRVLHLKLDTDKIVHFNYIKNIHKILTDGNYNNLPKESKPKFFNLINFLNSIPNDNEQYEFMQLFLENCSNLAIYLGYDAMYGGFGGFDEEDELDPEEIEIFNRGTVVAKQSKADYFIKMSEKEV